MVFNLRTEFYFDVQIDKINMMDLSTIIILSQKRTNEVCEKLPVNRKEMENYFSSDSICPVM